MSEFHRTTTRSEDAYIMRRLIKSMPASTFEMQTLCRLAGIKTSHDLPTAAVECKRRPRLLINPQFVKDHCERDEHLFLLVMHELWHVMLAHTRMYPRMTQAQNIAFDAIINAGLMRKFFRPEYMGFFDKLNPADDFPGCLLRPPVGWPHNPEYPEDVGPPGTAAILRRLYPPHNIGQRNQPMYEEVLNLLLKSGKVKHSVVLLGNHDGPEVHDPIMREMMEEISKSWPAISIDGQARGGGMGNLVGRRTYRLTEANEDARRTFSHTLQLCLLRRPGKEHTKAKVPVPAQGGNGVIPNARDRMAAARKALGIPSTLWEQPTTIKARLPERPSRSLVYLDVSGSMNFVISNLLDLLLPYVARKQAEVFQFSTEVIPMPLAELQKGLVTTSGGTDVNCVLEHALDVAPPVRRIIMLTDGETGSPLPHLVTGLDEHNLKLYVVLPHGYVLDQGVQAIAHSVVSLPPMYGL